MVADSAEPHRIVPYPAGYPVPPGPSHSRPPPPLGKQTAAVAAPPAAAAAVAVAAAAATVAAAADVWQHQQ